MSKIYETEIEMQKYFDKIKFIRNEIRCISDANLYLFSDWLANNELATVTEFIEAKADIERDEKDTF